MKYTKTAVIATYDICNVVQASFNFSLKFTLSANVLQKVLFCNEWMIKGKVRTQLK